MNGGSDMIYSPEDRNQILATVSRELAAAHLCHNTGEIFAPIEEKTL